MKIAVESSALLAKNRTGVEHYTYQLLNSTIRLSPRDKYNLVYLAFPGRNIPDFKLDYPNVTQNRVWWMPGKIYNALLRTPLAPPIDLLSGVRSDIFFFPNFARWPLIFTKRSVVIVHDISFIESSSTLVPHFRWFLKKIVPRSIKKATKVIAISESTKKQIIKHYNTDPAKISVVTPAIDHKEFFPRNSAESKNIRSKYGIEKEYILFLGTLEPRKNISGIVKAYLSLDKKIQEKFQLVLAGGKGWLDDEINLAIESAPEGRIIKTGYVEDADIPMLYSGATLYVYPSHYEGWGMQVLEAMACGAPVITANNSSLPEAGGEAALYVDSKNILSISSAMEKVLTSPNLQSEMRSKGFKHASNFTWEQSAEKLIKVFESLPK